MALEIPQPGRSVFRGVHAVGTLLGRVIRKSTDHPAGTGADLVEHLTAPLGGAAHYAVPLLLEGANLLLQGIHVAVLPLQFLGNGGQAALNLTHTGAGGCEKLEANASQHTLILLHFLITSK